MLLFITCSILGYTDPTSPAHVRMSSTNSQGEGYSFIESRSQSNSRELLNGKSPRSSNAHERYARYGMGDYIVIFSSFSLSLSLSLSLRDYMNSLGRSNKIQDQYGPDGSRDGLDHDPSDDQ